MSNVLCNVRSIVKITEDDHNSVFSMYAIQQSMFNPNKYNIYFVQLNMLQKEGGNYLVIQDKY